MLDAFGKLQSFIGGQPKICSVDRAALYVTILNQLVGLVADVRVNRLVLY